MHAVEAHLAAYTATGETVHLSRARRIAEALCVRQATKVAAVTGRAWVAEHYRQDWSVDTVYGRGAAPGSDDFRPYGLQPGHQFEWVKLQLVLRRIERAEAAGAATTHAAASTGGRCAAPWGFSFGPVCAGGGDSAAAVTSDRSGGAADARLLLAQELYDSTMEASWDTEYGGLVYAIDPHQLARQTGGESTVAFADLACDADKYFWVQQEAMTAAAMMAAATGEARCVYALMVVAF